MAKEQIHLMNDDLESTREKVHHRQEYALEMEGRLKAAVEKIEFHKSRLRMLGASPNGMIITMTTCISTHMICIYILNQVHS